MGFCAGKQTARDEWVELRQEASDLQEYSTAKIHRVTRYLGVLADKARRLGWLTDPPECIEFFFSLRFPLEGFFRLLTGSVQWATLAGELEITSPFCRVSLMTVLIHCNSLSFDYTDQ